MTVKFFQGVDPLKKEKFFFPSRSQRSFLRTVTKINRDFHPTGNAPQGGRGGRELPINSAAFDPRPEFSRARIVSPEAFASEAELRRSSAGEEEMPR